MNDPYKTLCKSILFIILVVLIMLLLSIVLPACHTHKATAATAQEDVAVVKAAAATTETAQRFQWASSLYLDIDSFSLMMPISFGEDTATGLPAVFADEAARPPHLQANVVVLQGKHASIGKADIAERNATRCAQQVDSVAAHRTMDKAEHCARDTVGIAKPPDLTWWPWAALAVLAAAALWYFKKHPR